MAVMTVANRRRALYKFVRSLSAQELFVRQLPVFSAAFLVASLLYRFGSFALECLAFLATWFVFDVVVETARRSWMAYATRGAVIQGPDIDREP
jgi:uncharacterized membrane protein (DUF4010 family)